MNIQAQKQTIDSAIRNSWNQLIQAEMTNPRITDYAKPLSDLLEVYDPTLFTTTQNRAIQQWMIRARNFLFAQSFGNQALHPTSNWQFYRLWILSKITVILKQQDMIQRLRLEFVEALKKSISPVDGSLEDFRTRDSVEYHAYCLYAIIQVTRILSPAFRSIDGQFLWQDVTTQLWEASIPAVRFMMGYAQNKKTHIEFVNSNQSSDRLRPEFNKPFLPSKCDYVLRALWDATASFDYSKYLD